VSFEWKIRSRPAIRSNATARDILPGYAAACALHFAEKALVEILGRRTKTWEKSPCPMRASAAASPRRVRGVLSPHGDPGPAKIANYIRIRRRRGTPAARSYGTPGRTKMPFRVSRSSRRMTGSTQGHRHHATVRSFDPCLRAGAYVPRQGEVTGPAALPTQSVTRGIGYGPADTARTGRKPRTRAVAHGGRSHPNPP